MDQALLNKIIPAVVPGLLSVLRTTVVSRDTLTKTLTQLITEIERGQHVPDNALAQARADADVLSNLLAGKR